jgi:hypothetical protein
LNLKIIIIIILALAYQCCDIDPKKRPTASMCVEEIELLIIEFGIDEHEYNKTYNSVNSEIEAK